MIQMPPCRLLSGRPIVCAVAPGTATVVWMRACSLSGVAGSVVAHELVGALAQGVVGVVGLPLDDRGAFLQLARRGSERPLDGFVRSLRTRARCNRHDTEDEQNYAFHFADPPFQSAP